MVVSSSKRVITDKWLKTTWNEFVEVAYDAVYVECSAYFYSGEMRLEMPSLGMGHSRQNSVVGNVITLFAACNAMDITSYTNGSFRKAGEKEFQPDIAFYIGEGARYLPPQNNSPISIELCGLPDLVVEVGASSIKDDLGRKRLMYERIGIAEYWVVDVEAKEVIAFKIDNDARSGQIRSSMILPGLEIDLVEEALRRSQTENDGAIARWLIKTFAS
ncbi:MAG: Uma2 family endonuclease [Cyanobacteria bacterium P01_D01_bin.105]